MTVGHCLRTCVLALMVLLASCGTARAADEDPLLDFGQIGPKEMEKLIREAVAKRLTVERQQVASEIRENLLYEEDDIAAAMKLLNDNPANTQTDNIRRICRAFARVDDLFAEAYGLYEAGKFDEAAEKLGKLIDLEQHTYLSAATVYLCGSALAGAGKTYQATDRYEDLLFEMPDRASFAAAACAEAAEAYEKMGRYLYAMQMYSACLMNYALTLPKEQVEQISEKVDKWSEVYGKPLKYLAGEMGDVEKRLRKADSGPQTRAKQDEIVAVLDDLIKSVEEQQNKQKQQQQQQRGQSQGRPGEEGSSGSRGQGQGQQQGRASGLNQPTQGATDSWLPSGTGPRPTKASERHTTVGEDRWAQLPPRQREKLEQIMKKAIPEKYRDLINDYHARLAEEESK